MKDRSRGSGALLVVNSLGYTKSPEEQFWHCSDRVSEIVRKLHDDLMICRQVNGANARFNLNKIVSFVRRQYCHEQLPLENPSSERSLARMTNLLEVAIVFNVFDSINRPVRFMFKK